MIKKSIKLSLILVNLFFLVLSPMFLGVIKTTNKNNDTLNISASIPNGLVVGTISGPAVLDPVDSWDSASNDVIRQVC